MRRDRLKRLEEKVMSGTAKGGITVFLSLILTCVCALAGGLLSGDTPFIPRRIRCLGWLGSAWFDYPHYNASILNFTGMV